MTNFASSFKQEVQKIARKELRVQLGPLQAANAAAKMRIRTLTGRIEMLERQLRTAKRGAVAKEAQSDDEATGLRFRAGGLASHRKRLGLSAADFGKLIGVSGLTVYNWESGKTRPRAAQLPKIAEVRKLGRREALTRLEAAG